MLRRIFGPKKEEVAGSWRRLHNEELCNLYASPNVTRMIKSSRMRWVRNVARLGKRRNAYKILVGKPEGNRPLGTHRRRWEDANDSGQGPMVGWCEHSNELPVASNAEIS